jgi:alkyl sulfatase BDS1-like metallo-beta-lactamase superfamily hydrolase
MLYTHHGHVAGRESMSNMQRQTLSGTKRGNRPSNVSEALSESTARLKEELPFSNRTDYEDAGRGFIATLDPPRVSGPDGKMVTDLTAYGFLEADEPPESVNPSLWRQAQLNMSSGLFKVTDRVFQFRGFDISNMSIIEGDTGLIVVDPLISVEVARSGLDLFYAHRPRRPVNTVIYTHSHVDHYGGVKGIVKEEDVRGGKVQILAPEGFLEAAVSENVFAGNAMSRRAIFQYGPTLPGGETGHVDTGLGKLTSVGTVTLIPPTDAVSSDEERTIDGVEFEFQLAQNTEAPAEMVFYLPRSKLLDSAEVVTHTMHNLYTLRGARVRDARAWWKTINVMIERWGDKVEALMAHHHWPTWGNESIVAMLKSQRDMYKFLHDQTLRLANQGLTPAEIADVLRLPDGLSREWYNREYYGSVSHNSKGVYQRYLGWYDSNPAHLNPLPPEESSARYVELMGGPEKVMDGARQSMERGEHRWAAELLDRVVFAFPDNKEARALEAQALEQMAYRSENPTWRNEYMMGAYELRNGPVLAPVAVNDPDTVKAMTEDLFFDYLGIRLDPSKAEGKLIKMNWNLTDVGRRYALELENSVLIYTKDKVLPDPDLSLEMPRGVLDQVIMGQADFDTGIMSGAIKAEGDVRKLRELNECFDSFEPNFPIVTP